MINWSWPIWTLSIVTTQTTVVQEKPCGLRLTSHHQIIYGFIGIWKGTIISDLCFGRAHKKLRNRKTFLMKIFNKSTRTKFGNHDPTPRVLITLQVAKLWNITWTPWNPFHKTNHSRSSSNPVPHQHEITCSWLERTIEGSSPSLNPEGPLERGRGSLPVCVLVIQTRTKTTSTTFTFFSRLRSIFVALFSFLFLNLFTGRSWNRGEVVLDLRDFFIDFVCWGVKHL